MDKYVIEGGRKLYGTIALQSAKNSVLPLLAASILTEKRVTIRETPSSRESCALPCLCSARS